MITRFTRDSLARVVHTEIAQGSVQPKLLFRFYRSGRRDGRRSTDTTITRNIITDAVHSASSHIALGYHQLQRELGVERARVTKEIKVLQERQTKLEHSSGDRSQPVANAAPFHAEGGAAWASDLEVQAAYAARSAQNQRREIQRANAEIQGIGEQIDQRRVRLDEIVEEASRAHRAFLEQIVTAQTQGASLWDRYSVGVHEGESRNKDGSRETRDRISFPEPESYLGDRGAKGLAAPDIMGLNQEVLDGTP